MALSYFSGKATTLSEGSGCLSNHLEFSFSVLRSMSAGKKRSTEALWRDFFANTSQWWDNRPEKINPRFPDFKHKQTQESLWVVDSRNPPWVQAQLATIPPGTVQFDAFTWAQRLKRHVKARQYAKAMEIFYQMQRERICPNARTFLPVLNACAGLGALEEGKHVHTQIIQVGCESDVYVASCLVDMYAKCGSIEDAWSMFSKIQEHDVVTWNAIIGGYVKSGQGLKAIEIFQKMQEEGVKPDPVTFVGVLNACASVAALQEGKLVHTQIVKVGCESDIYVATCLIDMYAKCGSIEDAWNVFRKMQKHNVVTFNAIIGGYVKAGKGFAAMELFRRMQLEGVKPDSFTFVGVLNACACTVSLQEGRRLHTQIIQAGYESDVYVANCLVDMYAKCGDIKHAWSVFIKLSRRNVITWSAMIIGYVKSGQALKAMELFQKMQQEGMKPDTATFVGVLNACASIAALEEGRHVHAHIIQVGYESDVRVANCLVDMYAKCGSIDDAWTAFNKMREPNVVAWNAMIRGCGMHGQAKEAIGLFEQMGKNNVEINEITFTCLLSACSHGGLVKEGLRYLKSMSSCFSILPTAEHYACVVDLLRRAGQLGEAEEVIKRVPFETDIPMWMSLFGACRIHVNSDMAEQAAKRGWKLDLGNVSRDMLIWKMYCAA